MLVNNYPKQSPIIGIAGLGGGINSYIFLSSGEDYVISRSLRFDSSASSYLNRTPSSAGNRRTFTWSGWLKKTSTGSTYAMFGSGTGSNDLDALDFNGEQFRYTRSTSGSFKDVKTNAVHRDPSAWYHVVLAVDTTQSTSSNRVKLYVNGDLQTSLAASNYPSQNEDTFINSTEPQVIGRRSSHQDNYFDGYLADVHLVDGQQLAATDFGSTDDDGVWQPKKFSGSHGTNGFHLDFKDNSSNAALGYDAAGSNNWTVNNLTAASLGLISKVTGGNTSTSDSATSLFNGTTSGTYIHPSAGNDVVFTNFAISNARIYSFNGNYQSNYANGKVYTNSTTTPVLTLPHDNAWQWYSLPADATLLYRFEGSIGAGNQAFGTHAIESGGAILTDVPSSAIDSLIDSPSQSVADETDTGLGGQITGNYATMSSIGKTKSEYFTEDGNLTCGNSSVPSGGSGSRGYVPSTIGMKTGKWYCECVTTRASDGDIDFAIGIFSQNAPGYYSNNGTTYNVRPDGKLSAPSNLVASYGTAWADGDVIGIAVDLDSSTKTIQWFKNNVAIANAFTISTDHEFFFGYGSDGGGGGRTYKATWNFGQRAFSYTAPSGFKCLTVENLATPTVKDGSKYFDTKLYDGTGSTQALTMANSGLSPDLVWIKVRSAGSSHRLFDTVRGAGKHLISNGTDAEATHLTSLSGFTSNGFTLGANGEGATNVNQNGASYAAWAWDAGDSNTTIAAGSLNSSSYLQGAVYSDSGNFTYTGTSGFTSNNGLDKLFDGRTDTQVDQVDSWTGGNSAHLTWTPATAIPVTSTLRIYGRWYTDSANNQYLQKDTVSINGNSEVQDTTVNSTSNHWFDLTSYIQDNSITSITEIKGISYPKGGNRLDPAFNAIEVDGKILVDSGVTPPNVPAVASTVRANPSAGFSIVSFTASGSTQSDSCAHGLNAVPGMVMLKRLDAADSWYLWHSSFSNPLRNFIMLNSTSAVVLDGSDQWGAGMTSSLIGFRSGGVAVGDMIAYCFSPVESYSAMGSYTGNGSADGPFVYTGFRPAFILVKNSSVVDNWEIYDSTRSIVNPTDHALRPDTSGVEFSHISNNRSFDILSNGFKIRGTNAGINGNNNTLVYYAVAENPFKSSRAR